MQTFLLKAKLVVVINGTQMSLQRRLIDRRLLFFDELGEPTTLTEYEFQRGYERREIEISADQPYLGEAPHVRNVAPDLTCFPLKHGEEALRRRRYLEGVLEGNTILPNKESLKEKLAEVAVKHRRCICSFCFYASKMVFKICGWQCYKTYSKTY
ncbi:putative transposase [Pseudomonas baetica]|uniref:Transposase n=1 Tax=Pseudomonas baetica TaxID=674054 RepID=A0ABX4Q0C0_9PSED|nr:hypothetical protein [Pseudomonas baetica]PKA70212.1 putative transposase [Pseudomonas baetica]